MDRDKFAIILYTKAQELCTWYYSDYDLFLMLLEERKAGDFTVYGG